MGSYAYDIMAVPQSNQVKNHAGGYVYEISAWERLRRFLILGHEGGTFYATPQKLSLETVSAIDDCLADDYHKTIDTIVNISAGGRAPSNDPAIFALAYCAAKGGGRYDFTDAVRISSLAMSKLSDVCRTGTHLFDFLNYCKQLGRGWGRNFREAVADWYTDRPEDRLAVQVTKYKQRNGWSHRDVLRKCHAQPTSELQNAIFQYVTRRDFAIESQISNDKSQLDPLWLFAAIERAHEDPKRKDLPDLIREFGLCREHLPTEALSRVDVWDALLDDMPLTALIRNLGKMTSIGLIKPLSDASRRVKAKLSDPAALKRQRVHPVTVVKALKQYVQGRGNKGKLSWTPDQTVTSALNDAFYNSFDAIEPTGKNYMLGIDVSGSMRHASCAGADILTCAEGAAVMAMTIARTEPNSYVFGFADKFRDLGITADDTLQDACRKVTDWNFGSTDTAVPCFYAATNKLDVDVFVIITDNETWSGPMHSCQALENYRQAMNKPAAKMAAMAMTNTKFSIADSNDRHMMDFVGFDAATLPVLADFAVAA
jgi:60 kDa SS-A/Ro ribonucleoprotein